MIRRLRNWLAARIRADEPLALVPLPADGETGTAIAQAMLADLITERRAERRWRLVKRSGLAIVFVGGLLVYAWMYMSAMGIPNPFVPAPAPGSLGVVSVTGPIGTNRPASAEKLIPQLKSAFESDRIRAVVLQIDSPGGTPVEAERIVGYIRAMRAKHPKPVYAVIDTLGASAAYMIAVSADEIHANRYSLVGSVGAMLGSWDVHRALERHEIERRAFASGDLKVMLDPFLPPTPEGTAKAQELVDGVGAQFLSDVRAARGERLRIAPERLGSGEVWSGEEAQALGLVDALGTLEALQAQLDDAPIKRYGAGGPFGLGLTSAVAGWAQALGAGLGEGLAGAALRVR